MRADGALLARGLARSRTRAARLIKDGRVTVNGVVISKPAHPVGESDTVEVRRVAGDDLVSRGGAKLAGALATFRAIYPAESTLADLRAATCLDAGASTGGFTQVLLREGAQRVYAVDVGHDQLAPELASDERVVNIEGCNIRDARPHMIYRADSVRAQAVVGDMSFISLQVVLPALIDLGAKGAWFFLLVKPQFEVGKADLGKGGIVREEALRARAIDQVCAAAQRLGLWTQAIIPSPLPGESGNVEYFLALHERESTAIKEDHRLAAIARVVRDNEPVAGPADGRAQGK